MEVKDVCGLCKKKESSYKCHCGLDICEDCLGYNYQDESFTCKSCYSHDKKMEVIRGKLYKLDEQLREIINESWKVR